MKCPFCAEEIQAEAKKCRYCGEWLDGRKSTPIKSARSGPGCLGAVVTIVVILVLVGVCSQIGGESGLRENELSSSEKNEMLTLVESLKSDGLIVKITPEYNEVQINMLLWSSLTYENKKTASFAMAVYCGVQKGTDIYWCEIVDAMSGKKVAKYSRLNGLEVY